MEDRTIILLHECSDYKELYGVLAVKNATVKQVQNKIYKIKNKLWGEDYNWTIDDVVDRFPAEWDCKFMSIEHAEI